MMDMYLSIIKVILMLAGMVAAIVVLYRYSGKLRLGFPPKGAPYGTKKLDTIHLGYKKFVAVIEVEDHILVVGVGEKEISLLTQWKKGDVAQ